MLRPVILKKFDGFGKQVGADFIWEQLKLTGNNYDVQVFENDMIVKLDVPHSEVYHQFSPSEWGDLIRYIESNFGALDDIRFRNRHARSRALFKTVSVSLAILIGVVALVLMTIYFR